MKQDLLKIIKHYGIDKQLKYIHSEYFELDEAIIVDNWAKDILTTKEYKDYKKESIKHIAEELADVMVMLKQFQYYYGIEDSEIEDIMKSKIQRQLERIEKDKE